MANYLINRNNLALVEGTDKTTGDSLEARTENLEERIEPLEVHSKWIFAGSTPTDLSETTITIPAGVNPEEFLVMVPAGGSNARMVTIIPALADSVTNGSRQMNYYIGNESTGIVVVYVVNADASGKRYHLTYSSERTLSMYVYYR